MAEDFRDPARLVSVIIAAYNAADTIPDPFAALEAQTFQSNWEVVVADNALHGAKSGVLLDSSCTRLRSVPLAFGHAPAPHRSGPRIRGRNERGPESR
jgi:hypothetical protein